MAQVFKRKWTANGKETVSDVYYCRFQLGGRDYVRSTGKTTKREAEIRKKEILQETRDGTQVEHSIETLKRAISELPEPDRDKARRKAAAELLRDTKHKLSIAGTWQTWIDSPRKRTPGASTLAAYSGQWKRFREWAEKQDIDFLHEVDELKAQAYATDLSKSNVSPRTYNAHIKLLRAMFKTLSTVAGLPENVWQGIALKESSPEGRRNLTPKELTAICEKAQGTLRYLFVLGIYTGMRLGDCVCLEWSCVDFKDGFITHMPSKTKRKKRLVRIPIHPVLMALLQELRKKSKGRYLFPKERKTYHTDTTTISKQVQDFLKNTCKIETQEVMEGRKYAVCRVGFHSMRHSFVSLCASNRVPQAAMMELVGHGSPAMTALYSHAGDEQKAAAIAALPSFGIENGNEGKR